jgi:hypothetical protein
MSEHLEQVRTVAWLRKEYPQYRVYAIANGGKRSMNEARKLKAEGVLKGVHDMHIPAINLWVEMKVDSTKKPSKEQKEWGEYVGSIGHTWILGLGFEDAKEKIQKYIDSITP